MANWLRSAAASKKRARRAPSRNMGSSDCSALRRNAAWRSITRRRWVARHVHHLAELLLALALEHVALGLPHQQHGGQRHPVAMAAMAAKRQPQLDGAERH